MPTCGSCKQSGQTIEHVRSCYSDRYSQVKTLEITGFAKAYVETKAAPVTVEIPDSKYALEVDGSLRFYEVRHGKGQWAGRQFLTQLIGHPGDWKRVNIKFERRDQIMALIAVDPKTNAVRFSKEFTVCAVCQSPLSDSESLATGLGPICQKRF